MRRRALSLPLALITLALTLALPAAATPTASTPPTPSQGISRASTPSTGLGLWCTAGLPARKGSRTFVLTAGHCATSGEKVYTRWTKGKRTVLGRVTGTSARLDIAVIETTKRPAPVRGTATVRPGQQVCQHGARSGRVCGITVTGNTRDRAGIRTVYGRVTPAASPHEAATPAPWSPTPTAAQSASSPRSPATANGSPGPPHAPP